MEWSIETKRYAGDDCLQNGNQFLIGNGYLGYRGTMEEYGKDKAVACNLAGLYDKAPEQTWRESVNAPNGLYCRILCDNQEISLSSCRPQSHLQSLDYRYAVHSRHTIFPLQNGTIEIRSERFASLANRHLLCMKYTLKSSIRREIQLETGIDGEVWDIHGPHFRDMQLGQDDALYINAICFESGKPIAVCEECTADFPSFETVCKEEKRILRKICFTAEADIDYTVYKYVCIYHSNDAEEPLPLAKTAVRQALAAGYHRLLLEHQTEWDKLWKVSDVIIEGDDEAQQALRYSIYHLLIIAPREGSLSIPARGLSGQTYKGAVFWDTEMFLLPFFLHTDIETAKRLVQYRIRTLDGARRKARDYGYSGAFYAWESQDTGDDACSDYNVTDVFTGRPMRTHFKDKQIHISGAVADAVWLYYEHTGDDDLLMHGGAETILECAEFYCSYLYYKPCRDRYELLDVVGPDEYHERVNNNAYTNKIARYTIELALKVMEQATRLSTRFSVEANRLTKKYGHKLFLFKKVLDKLYIPQPDSSGVIPQFDGYFALEETTADVLKSRLLHPQEYWGGAYGVASQTQVIKQADVVLMLSKFPEEYSLPIKQANIKYYEPRTEHGSSLSASSHCLLACEIGDTEKAYRYFMKTATVDLTGDSKQFAGLIYIGGTHPAANGGAWMCAVLGFGGLKAENGIVSAQPRLPKHWNRLAFTAYYRGQRYKIDIRKGELTICPE